MVQQEEESTKQILHTDEIDAAAFINTMVCRHCLLVVLVHHHHCVAQRAFCHWMDRQFCECASRLHFAELVRINNNHVVDDLVKGEKN